MSQFVIALLLGGFFSTLVLCLQHLFDVYDAIHKVDPTTNNQKYDFEVNIPYSSNYFRDPKNHPWMFTDAIMGNIINYFRSELISYKGKFDVEESIELSYILYDKTYLVETFFRETKRGKLSHELFEQVVSANFEVANEEKQFLLRNVFKEAHNSLVEDLIAGTLHVAR